MAHAGLDMEEKEESFDSVRYPVMPTISIPEMKNVSGGQTGATSYNRLAMIVKLWLTWG